MKKRTLWILLAVALLVTCAVFAVQAEPTTIDLKEFKCPCTACVEARKTDEDYYLPLDSWITYDEVIAGTSITAPADGAHYYIDGNITPGGQISTGSKEVVVVLDNATYSRNDNNEGRAILVGGAGGKLHLIGNNATFTTKNNTSYDGIIAQISNATAELHLYGDLKVQKGAGTGVSTNSGLFRMFQGTLHIHDGEGLGLPTDKDPVLNAPALANTTASLGGIAHLENSSCTFIMDAGTLNGTSKAFAGGVISMAAGKVTINGGTINGGSATNGGAIYVNGGTVNLNAGTINGGVASGNGGAIYVNNGMLNIGCDTVNYPDGPIISGGQAVIGGCVYIDKTGSAEMKAGSISGGHATSVGGAVYVSGDKTTRGLFEMSGGTVTGDATKSGKSKGIRVQWGELKLSGTATVVSAGGGESGCGIDLLYGLMSLDGNARVYTPEGTSTYDILLREHASAKLTVEKTWTGSATVRFNHIVNDGSYAPGTLIGETWAVSTGDYTGQLYLQSEETLPRIYGENGTLMFADVAICNADGAYIWHRNNADAVAAYAKDADAKQYIKLFSGKALDLNGNDAYVDFNGNTVTVTTGAGTLYGFDSTSSNTVAGSAKVTLNGNTETFVTNPVTGESSVTFTEGDVTTFHTIKPVVTGVSLRPGSAGLYYSAKLYCDPMLAAHVDAYGVALSTEAMPDEAFATNSLYTEQTETPTPGGSFNGVLVNNILKSGEDNEARAQQGIFANAYVTVTVNGQTKTYLSSDSGNAACLDLKTVVRKINGIWRTLNDTQKAGVSKLYEDYESLMNTDSWKLYNIEAESNGDTHVKSDLKVLMIGNSLSVDAGHMLAYIAKLEGAESIHISTLYYAGCTLAQHVDFLTNDKPVYRFYNNYQPDLQSVTDLSDLVPEVLSKGDNYTMKMGIEYNNTPWDIIVMQQGVFQAGQADTYNEDMQTIMDYVRAHCANPEAIFVWNSIWAGPVDPAMVEKSRNEIPPDSTGYESSYKTNVGYASDKALDADAQNIFFGKIVDAVRTKVETNPNFVYWIPSGTAQQNALSSELLGDQELYRDYIHASDLGRYIYSYVWYCALTGMEFEGVKEDEIPYEIRYINNDDQSEVEPPPVGQGYELTDEIKDIITWSIQKAFENPYECTPYVASADTTE